MSGNYLGKLWSDDGTLGSKMAARHTFTSVLLASVKRIHLRARSVSKQSVLKQAVLIFYRTTANVRRVQL